MYGTTNITSNQPRQFTPSTAITCSPNSVDSLDKLPPEIIAHIADMILLSGLERSAVRNVQQLRCTCRTIYTLLTNTPSCIRKIIQISLSIAKFCWQPDGAFSWLQSYGSWMFNSANSFINRYLITTNYKSNQTIFDKNRFFYLLTLYGPQITHLDLGYIGSNLTDRDLQSIVSLCPNISSLDLSSCENITDKGMEHLKTLKFLTELYLRNCCKITTKGLEHLKVHVHLKTLSLEKCYVITGLMPLKALPSLQALNLENCGKVTDSDLIHLEELKSLRSLNLSWCREISNIGLASLSKHALRSLHLEWCKIRDSSLSHLGKLTSLHTLNINGSEMITDLGLAYLQDLKLRKLGLSHCTGITDAGLGHLQRLSTLEKLNMVFCSNVTENAVRSLGAALKNTQIDYVRDWLGPYRL